MRAYTEIEEVNVTFLTQQCIDYALVRVTVDGCKKSMLEVAGSVRYYFEKSGIHDYANQLKGQEHKVTLSSFIWDGSFAYLTKTSLFRCETASGDSCIWTDGMEKYCKPNDILALIYYSKRLHIINLTRIDVQSICTSEIHTPLKHFINSAHRHVRAASEEIADFMQLTVGWHPYDKKSKLTPVQEIARILPGIKVNSSNFPTYKGIELRNKLDGRTTFDPFSRYLFTQAPDWKSSQLHSAKEIVNVYGFCRDRKKRHLDNTMSCLTLNSQNLGLTLYPDKDILAIEEKKPKVGPNNTVTYTKVADVAFWQLSVLRNCLLSEFHEAFCFYIWRGDVRGCRCWTSASITHSKNPIVSQLDYLLETGYITVEMVQPRSDRNSYKFKFYLKKEAMDILFPMWSKIEICMSYPLTEEYSLFFEDGLYEKSAWQSITWRRVDPR